MKYRLSPLNFFAAIVVGLLIVTAIEPDPEKGMTRIIYLASVLAGSLAIDLLFQKFSKNHVLTCLIETALIFVFIILVANFFY